MRLLIAALAFCAAAPAIAQVEADRGLDAAEEARSGRRFKSADTNIFAIPQNRFAEVPQRRDLLNPATASENDYRFVEAPASTRIESLDELVEDVFGYAGGEVPFGTASDIARAEPIVRAQGPPAALGDAVTTTFGGVPVGLKKMRATYTLVGTADSGFGLNEFDLSATSFSPVLPGFSITPGFGGTFADESASFAADVPDQLYNLQLTFSYRGQINIQYGYEVAVTPSFFTDFNNTTSDAFRLPARALLFIAMSRQLQFAVGVVYLDRDDILAVPALGMIYAPNPDLRYELVFPRPKVTKKIGSGPNSEIWGYIGGEFGGGSWAVERASGLNDEITIRDFRLIVGAEQKYDSGLAVLVETGYVFGRDVEFESGIGDFSPDSSFLFRVGLRR
ncbi:hypothetical protein [Stratiformator vulcanicus]|uniref:hypothetical protein n=1 Tax=Stratiformator vulcanicus TaxID=2527980 RepID=UPI0011A243C0|nr:hypothetical protein [Stratiformator vulcanicus]